MTLLTWGMLGTPTAADDGSDQQNDEISKSIENILQKASEQGFVDLKSDPENTVPETVIEAKAPEIIIEPLSVNEDVSTSCEAAGVLDLEDYKSVQTYNDVAIAKSTLESVETLDDRIPLLKSYWSLGLGTEAVALVQPFDRDNRAELLASVSKVLSGDISEKSKAVLERHAQCNDYAEIWYKTALADTGSKTSREGMLIPDANDLELLEKMPEHLRQILVRRLGIFAAEAGDYKLAEQMLRTIEPEAKNGNLPIKRDDEIMYLFALLDTASNGEKGYKILEKLSQYDGVLRTRSLFQLSKKISNGGKAPYPGFSDDLKAVSQQYRGKEESRRASLETIKLYLENGSMTESMKLAKREIDIEDPERVEIVTLIADNILSGLNHEKNQNRIAALNAYLFDSGFFDPLESHAELKYAALKAALALNLPELQGHIYTEKDTQSLDKNGLKLLTLVKAKAARKSGDIEDVKALTSTYSDDPEFKGLLVQSLVEAGRSDEAIKIVKAMPSGPEQYAKLADIEWQAGDFKSAHSSLQSLDYATGGKLDNKRLQLSGFLTSAETSYSNMKIPNSPDGLDEFQSDIEQDINITKAYLTGG